MKEFYSRTEMMLSEEGVAKLKNSCVAVFGVGGVGGYAVEALARAGVGEIHLVDSDRVSESNINRQIIATHLTVGQYKTEAMRDRILSINPDAKVVCHSIFFDNDTKCQFEFTKYNYIIDAIDSLGAKIELIAMASETGTPIISAMGAGNKLDPTRFEVSDIYKTSVCPLARVMRTELKKLGIRGVKVLFSKEPPVLPKSETTDHAPGSISFVPAAAGLCIAGEVIRTLSSPMEH